MELDQIIRINEQNTMFDFATLLVASPETNPLKTMGNAPVVSGQQGQSGFDMLLGSASSDLADSLSNDANNGLMAAIKGQSGGNILPLSAAEVESGGELNADLALLDITETGTEPPLVDNLSPMQSESLRSLMNMQPQTQIISTDALLAEPQRLVDDLVNKRLLTEITDLSQTSYQRDQVVKGQGPLPNTIEQLLTTNNLVKNTQLGEVIQNNHISDKIINDIIGKGASANSPSGLQFASPTNDLASLAGLTNQQGPQNQQLLSLVKPQLPINLQLEQPGWGNEMANRVSWMVKQNIQVAELKLNPPQYGSIEVRVTVNNDQASVVFTSQHIMVRDTLEANIPRLREMFEETGMNYIDVDVNGHKGSDENRAEHENIAGNGFNNGNDSVIPESDDLLTGQNSMSYRINNLDLYV